MSECYSKLLALTGKPGRHQGIDTIITVHHKTKQTPQTWERGLWAEEVWEVGVVGQGIESGLGELWEALEVPRQVAYVLV